MILALTPNPAIDLTVTVPTLELGTSHRVDPAVWRAGGKGVNVARILHAEAVEVTALGPVGGVTGDWFTDDLATVGMKVQLIPSPGKTRLSTALIEVDADRATLLNEHGSPLSRDVQLALVDAVRRAPGASALVVAGSLPPDTDPALVGEFVTAAETRGVPAIVDTSGPGLAAAASAQVTVLKANRHELAAATRLADPRAAARSMLHTGARWVVVTGGADGIYATDGRIEHVCALDTPLTGNPTGAGDAATAAIAAEIGEHGAAALADSRTLARAVAWSASAVLAPVAGELTPGWPQFLDRVAVQTRRHGTGESPWR